MSIANSDLRVILVTSVQLQLHKGEGQIMLRNTSWNCYAARRRRRPLERGSQKIPQHLRPRPFNKRCREGIFLSSTIWLQLSFQCCVATVRTEMVGIRTINQLYFSLQKCSILDLIGTNYFYLQTIPAS